MSEQFAGYWLDRIRQDISTASPTPRIRTITTSRTSGVLRLLYIPRPAPPSNISTS